jgi:hypothetical protein
VIHCFSVKDSIKDIKKNLINECIEQRTLIKDCNNFELKTIYLNNLYQLFITNAKKVLNNFTLKDENFKVWCYMTDKLYSDTHWHNHIKSATINSVIYLKTNDNGIDFMISNEEKKIMPNDGDMLIFPASIYHRPEPSTDSERISLNLEMRCNENEKEIFNV